MSQLTVFLDSDPHNPLLKSRQPEEIARELQKVGVRFERWPINEEVQLGAASDRVLEAYDPQIKRLMSAGGYQAVDVISVSGDRPEVEMLRHKFLAEHTHSEDEVRFFVAGRGLFSLHVGDRVLEVLCTQGDLLGVPENTPHWFDMGPQPNFTAIRLFTNPQGWVANFTGSDIASKFSRLEN